MNILVLGGYGFIGSHVVEKLVSEGHFVRVFARHASSLNIDAEYYQGDFIDSGQLAGALVGIDTVVHCISATVPLTSAIDPVFDINSNLIGTIRLLRLMKTQGVHRLVYLSSGGTVYGNPQLLPVAETAPLNPVSSHGAVKVSIEKFIHIAEVNWGLDSVIIRPSNAYGERQGHLSTQGIVATVFDNVLRDRPTRIFGDGGAVRDYIYVKDLATLVAASVTVQSPGVFNAGSGYGVSVTHILRLIEQCIGKPIDCIYEDAREFDVFEIVLDSQRAERCYGWKASTDLKTGIEQYYQWLSK